MTFVIDAEDGNARLGRLTTMHGEVRTPAFMPVGTYGAVQGVSPQELRGTGADIMLSNAFHLMLSPGEELIEELGGIQRFSGWNRPILTDSGGFQIWSLSKMCKIKEEGAQFRSPLDGKKVFLSPEISMDVQKKLNSDIVMVLDECTEYPVSYDRALSSLELSARWAKRCKDAYTGQGLLFGIVQGSMYSDLREYSFKLLNEIQFDGYALGGLSVGEDKENLYKVLESSIDYLPKDKPHYLMGVGTPSDLLAGVERGIDMFDCVMPTRNARNGYLFTSRGIVRIKNSQYRCNDRALDLNCECYTCKHFSLAYLYHLFKKRSILSSVLNSIHNLFFYQSLMSSVRESIAKGNLSQFIQQCHQQWSQL